VFEDAILDRDEPVYIGGAGRTYVRGHAGRANLGDVGGRLRVAFCSASR
jgi:hypothetical protein